MGSHLGIDSNPEQDFNGPVLYYLYMANKSTEIHYVTPQTYYGTPLLKPCEHRPRSDCQTFCIRIPSSMRLSTLDRRTHDLMNFRVILYRSESRSSGLQMLMWSTGSVKNSPKPGSENKTGMNDFNLQTPQHSVKAWQKAYTSEQGIQGA